VALPLVQAVETRLTLPSSDHDVLTSATFEASADELWSAVQALDSLEAERPLLMELGLPVPTHCTLSGEAEGSERICYFDQGFIRQRVTHWEPPRRMVLRIEETDLGGRYWLGFAEAEYRLSETQGVTQITRRTTISSALRPRAYWQRIEGWMVDTEHEFLFAELRRRFSPRE